MKTYTTNMLTHMRWTNYVISYAAFTAVALLPFAPMSTVSAQDDEAKQELKEAIKQEILQELRGESLIGASEESAMDKLKKEIVQEILEALRAQQEAAEASVNQAQRKLKEDLREEILKDLNANQPGQHPQAARYTSGSFGHAEGVMLRRGLGLRACKVKLVALSGTTNRFQGYSEGEEYITVTDEKGKYRFDNLPVGPYKLKWELPGDTGWIRRLRDRPDVIVRESELSVLKPVETARPLLSES